MKYAPIEERHVEGVQPHIEPKWEDMNAPMFIVLGHTRVWKHVGDSGIFIPAVGVCLAEAFQ